MAPYYTNGQVTLYHGHVIDQLRALPADSVQCVVTSPPYWALRAYGTEAQVWGGDPECEHVWTNDPTMTSKQGSNSGSLVGVLNFSDCRCGAWRGELGHEPTPQLFVSHLVEIFREVRRVLKPDGVCFVNLGDSYSGSGKGPTGHNGIGDQEERQGFRAGNQSRYKDGASVGNNRDGLGGVGGIRAKSLVLIPERFALAMQDDGWIVRSRIAWCKRAPMPESVRDRPTSAWEHIFLFTKSGRYFWDANAVRESTGSEMSWEEYRAKTAPGATWKSGFNETHANGSTQYAGAHKKDGGQSHPSGRNSWNYWLLSPDPEPLAHFATFPKEIPRRCIAAATSERGECPECGKSWVRVVERQYVKSPVHGAGSQMRKHSEGTDTNGWAGMPRVKLESSTTGWVPQCDHNIPPQASVVLDPFIGSGTVCQVATSLGRRSIGIDLSEEYLRAIATRKVAQMGLIPEIPVPSHDELAL